MSGLKELVRFALDLDLGNVPEEVRDVGKRGILDTLGCCLVGVRSDAAAVLREQVRYMGETPREATVLGSGMRVPATTAALVNGTMGHANDFDDVQRQMQGHPSVGVFPAVLAIGEAVGCSGRDLLAGYIAGVEADVALGVMMNPKHYAQGWHATSTIGSMGACLAASKMLRLTEQQALVALGICSSVACGLQANFGTMTKPLHAGKAAWNGVFSATMAKLGWTANPDFLDHKVGYLRAFGSEHTPSALKAVTGGAYATKTLQFKKYPSCAESHPPIEAALRIRARHPIDVNQVEKVECLVNSLTEQVCQYNRPRTPLEGKFSAPYCVAHALVHGKVGMYAFTDEGLKDEAVQRLVSVTTTSCEIPEILASFGPAEVRVHLKNGQVLTARYGDGGEGADPLPWADVIAKFRDCAAGIIDDGSVEKVISMVRDIENVKDTRKLCDLLVGTRRQGADSQKG